MLLQTSAYEVCCLQKEGLGIAPSFWKEGSVDKSQLVRKGRPILSSFHRNGVPILAEDKHVSPGH